MGGGQHGYIFLILVDERWKNIPGTIPFVKPVDSEVFVTAVTTNATIATEKAQWEDDVRLYNEYQFLESTLKN